jgi:acyl dehydratase
MAAPPITRTTLALFAGASGDHHPIHIDLDVARSAGLEDVFAHGMLSMAYVARLVTDWVPQERVSITPVHGQPTCTGTVTAVEDGVVTIDIAVTLADGTKTIEGQALVTAED